MSTAGLPKPYVVAAFFGDTAGAYLMIAAQASVSVDAATGLVISKYYLEQGGKLPLLATAAMELSRETLTTMLAMFDAIDAAEAAGEQKVVGLVPQPSPIDFKGSDGGPSSDELRVAQDRRLIRAPEPPEPPAPPDEPGPPEPPAAV